MGVGGSRRAQSPWDLCPGWAGLGVTAPGWVAAVCAGLNLADSEVLLKWVKCLMGLSAAWLKDSLVLRLCSNASRFRAPPAPARSCPGSAKPPQAPRVVGWRRGQDGQSWGLPGTLPPSCSPCPCPSPTSCPLRRCCTQDPGSRRGSGCAALTPDHPQLCLAGALLWFLSQKPPFRGTEPWVRPLGASRPPAASRQRGSPRCGRWRCPTR